MVNISILGEGSRLLLFVKLHHKLRAQLKVCKPLYYELQEYSNESHHSAHVSKDNENVIISSLDLNLIITCEYSCTHYLIV
jgi:hypothetical protein